MSVLSKSILGATVAVGALTFSVLSASAYIACSGNTCWHVTERHDYPAHARVVIHEDNWKWRSHEHYRWHEHEGRGYWRGGVWVGW
jgi:hypothetical protein